MYPYKKLNLFEQLTNCRTSLAINIQIQLIEICKHSNLQENPKTINILGTEHTVYQIMSTQLIGIQGEVITAGTLGGWISNELLLENSWLDEDSYLIEPAILRNSFAEASIIAGNTTVNDSFLCSAGINSDANYDYMSSLSEYDLSPNIDTIKSMCIIDSKIICSNLNGYGKIKQAYVEDSTINDNFTIEANLKLELVDTYIGGNVSVLGNNSITNSKILGTVAISGSNVIKSSKLTNNVSVDGHCRIVNSDLSKNVALDGEVHISDSTMTDSAKDAVIIDESEIYDEAIISDNVKIMQSTVKGNAKISGFTVVRQSTLGERTEIHSTNSYHISKSTLMDCIVNNADVTDCTLEKAKINDADVRGFVLIPNLRIDSQQDILKISKINEYHMYFAMIDKDGVKEPVIYFTLTYQSLPEAIKSIHYAVGDDLALKRDMYKAIKFASKIMKFKLPWRLRWQMLKYSNTKVKPKLDVLDNMFK